MSEHDYALILQNKVLEKYGAQYGIGPDVLDKIDRGTATESELLAYTEHADKLVDKFKADMRQTEPADYSELDIEIITAMAATNYATYQANNETFSKVISGNGVGFALAGGPPTINGFAAMNRYSEHLSPQQIVSQFGLDYEQNRAKAGEPPRYETPYLVDSGADKVPVPIVFCLKAPMTDEIRKAARIPFDPRVLDKIRALSDDAGASDEIRKMAKMLLDPDVSTLAVRKVGEVSQDIKDRLKALGHEIPDGGNDAPYTGNSMPQFGAKLEARSSYSDLIQETSIKGKVETAAGTAIYLKVPRPDPRDPSVPAGSVETKVAEWDGEKWHVLVTKEELEAAQDAAIDAAPVTEEAKAALRSKKLTHDTLLKKFAEGEAKRASEQNLATPLPEAAQKKIEQTEAKAKRELLTELTGDALVAAAAVKLKKTKKQQDEEARRKAKKRREEQEEQEQQEAAEQQERQEAAEQQEKRAAAEQQEQEQEQEQQEQRQESQVSAL